jgi:hypothetical protein
MNAALVSRRRPVARAGATAAVVVGLALLLVGRGRDGGHEVTVLRGTATGVNDTRTAIWFDGRRTAGPRLGKIDEDGGWIVAGATWYDGRSWHDQGTPTCLDGGAQAPAIELGVLEARSRKDAPGRGVVVWLKCLDRP